MEYSYYTSRLMIKMLDDSCASQVLSFYKNNKELFECYEPKHPEQFYTLNYQASLLNAERNLCYRGQGMRFFLFEKAHPDLIIGTVNFYHIMRSPHNSCKLGYKLGASAWHKGYAFEAISFLIPILFKEGRVKRIEADILPTNTRSLSLIQRLNFCYEGIARQCCEINGKRQDHCRYSMIASDIMPSERKQNPFDPYQV